MNHRTTTTLLVVIGIATLLVAGIVVAIVRSNHSAFAHKNYDKFNKEDNSGRDGNQYLKCIVVENGGISDNSCNNHDGATPTPTPTPSNCNGVEDDGNNLLVERNEQFGVGIAADPDTTQPPGVICPPGEDEPANMESLEQPEPTPGS